MSSPATLLAHPVPKPDLLQEIDVLLQEQESPHPDAEKYFKGTPFPECSYKFWTVHAQKCVTGRIQAHGPDMTLSDPDVEWSWAGLTGLAEPGRVSA